MLQIGLDATARGGRVRCYGMQNLIAGDDADLRVLGSLSLSVCKGSNQVLAF